MGLDLSCNKSTINVHFSYNGFHTFRRKIAESIGIDLDEMNGFKQDSNGNDIPGIPWSTVKSDVKYLLNHSDCDGKIGAKRCMIIAPALKPILATWKNDFWKEDGEVLLELMYECYRTDSPLIFS